MRQLRFELDRAIRPRLAPASARTWIRRLRRAAARLAPVESAWTLRVVGDTTIRDLHLEHLGLEGPTDVLSFPASPVPGGEHLLGDVVVNWDAVVRQARGDRVADHLDEATTLALHGLVHLLGHDHDTRSAARRMFRHEQRAGRVAGLGALERPYAR